MDSEKVDSKVTEKLVVSKKRVTDHGEVYTGKREVNAMLDLVKHETERIESRFLEPACGTGNFLTEILARKLKIVESRYRKSQLDYERNALKAISSIYGIDILKDNALACRKRLFDNFNKQYTRLFKKTTKTKYRKAVKFILERNIIHGDALTLKTKEEKPQPIVFSEWSFPFNNSMIKQRDFIFSDLIPNESTEKHDLFSDPVLISDQGERAFIPKETRSYPPVHFLRINDEK